MEALQIIWFLLIGVLLIGYAILDGFDLGVGFWHFFAKKKNERTAFIHSIEPFWDGNEVWLLTGGGALFAAFPPVYATVFSGLYLAMMLVLLGLIFRATAIEFRNKVDHPGWVKAWDFAFAIGSVLPSILYGVAIGNVLQGLELNAIGDYTAGFVALLNPFALLCGLVGLAMFALHGALYLSMKLDAEIANDARKWAAKAWYVFLALFMIAVILGLKNCIYGIKAVPVALIILALVSNVLVFMFNKKAQSKAAFLSSCFTIAFVMLAVAGALFPNMVPCSNDPEWSLTVFNSSSSQLTLISMLVIALIGMPLVLGYTWFIHRVFKDKVKVHED
ncbi:cytochrome d ubiquinol oxidase subunit II [Pontiella sulfatireligans]|uniref:Cytochrome bd-I ubiquinol oxidase subunit 2 n=1 Tax=Pontiella sulfatireligans TaxID=2750658 RepID=A0A6C2ULM0_9BACT|nr:cytochrome d ubiquinol oxidase subunit II [Pontiella sulfatireligans]VGO21150.1 Cytochrome bd-I ubiquinol oxidase subunit 2 [Pontiella sulfatireligans]